MSRSPHGQPHGSNAIGPAPDLRPRPGRGGVHARTIGALTPRVTKTAFEKFGFATAQLVSDWRQIAGERLATATAPEKIRWPRRAEGGGVADERGGQRSGATLVLRVEPAVALDVQYQTAQIIDRINAYFGYRAIAEVRLVQGPVERRKPSPSRPVAPSSARPHGTLRPAPAALAAIADDGLKAALERMQSGIRARLR